MLFSCGGNDQAAVKEAANGFIKAMNKMDLESARKYVTDSSKIMVDQMITELKNMPEDRKKMFNEKMAEREKITVTIKDTRIYGDKATVSFTVSDEPSKIDSIPLVKAGGKWLADFKGF